MSQTSLTAQEGDISGGSRSDPRRRSWQSMLGVSSNVTAVNLASFLLHSSASILFLVFLNATQPFLISQLGETRRQGSLSGTLVFSDELLSMFLVLFWGSLADLTGTRLVAVSGYGFIAIALLSYTLARSPWPDLLFCRLAFAVGGSAVTAMLSAILNSYSASHPHPAQLEPHRADEEGEPAESTSLLNHPDPPRQHSRHGRLAALTGVMTGVGALIAVFFLLRLPTLLASLHDRNAPADLPEDGGDESVQRGTKEAFYIVAALAALVALLLAFGLKMDQPAVAKPTPDGEGSMSRGEEENIAGITVRQARRQRLKRRLETRGAALDARALLDGARSLFSGIFTGFDLARNDSTLKLGYLSGGLARACTIATTVFIPLLVTRFFYTSGLCSSLPSPDVPPSELKRTCRQAFTVASILSGVIQLIALLLSPLVGYMCEALSPAITLLISTLIGTASFLTISLGLPNNGDPRSPIAWIAAIGIGFCQISAIVTSLALCANAKSKANLKRESGKAFGLGGSIAGAYSATGGLSILVISKLGGSLSDLYSPAAFLLLALFSALTSLLALTVVVQERTESKRRRQQSL